MPKVPPRVEALLLHIRKASLRLGHARDRHCSPRRLEVEGRANRNERARQPVAFRPAKELLDSSGWSYRPGWARPPTGCARSAGTYSATGRRSASTAAPPAGGSSSRRTRCPRRARVEGESSAARCPACEAPFSSTFAVDCEECGKPLRPPGLLGMKIRRPGLARNRNSASIAEKG